MHRKTRARTIAGLAAVIGGVALIGTSGIAFVIGWVVWACGLGALLTAVPTAGGDRREAVQFYAARRSAA